MKFVFKVALLLLAACVDYSRGYKILGVAHTFSRSHFIIGSALMKELARRGHEVTVISPFPLKQPLQNYTNISAPTVIKTLGNKSSNMFQLHDYNPITNLFYVYHMGLKLTAAVLDDPAVQQLIHSNRTFDVVICEVFLSEALFGLAEHFNAPLVGLGTFGAILWNNDMVGSPSPPSYIPSTMLQLTHRMTLVQRIANLAFLTFERLSNDFYYLPRQEELYRSHFPHAKRTLNEVRRNAALVLLNQHVSLGYPRPYMPNHIEVGGMHISPQRSPLPANIQRFLDDATAGAIYFSMGSNLRSKDMPPEKRNAILDAFRALPQQRVLWKFEEPDLVAELLPPNVLIADWLPQSEILAHPNVRIFVTHGGLLSITEAIYFGKPLIGIPIFGDQFMNMARAELDGYALLLDYSQLTAERLTAAATRILQQSSYTQQARAISARYHDQPLAPLALAVHWVEHVVRHDGATYLHCAGLDLNFWQYHSIDTIAILCSTLLLILLLPVALLYGACRKICAGLHNRRLQRYQTKIKNH